MYIVIHDVGLGGDDNLGGGADCGPRRIPVLSDETIVTIELTNEKLLLTISATTVCVLQCNPGV